MVDSGAPEAAQVSEVESHGTNATVSWSHEHPQHDTGFAAVQLPAQLGFGIGHHNASLPAIDQTQGFDGQVVSTYLEDIDMSVDFDDILDDAFLNPDHALNPSDLLSPQSNQHLMHSPPSSVPSTSFPDSYLLPMPELTLLRAFLRIATRLNAHTLWDMAANSPFNTGDGPSPSVLPPTWQPTASQLTMPHHPVVDLLPWPGVRDRMIGIMSLTDADNDGISVTPPTVMRDGSIPALLNFIYDVEDGAEGMRIWGSDPYDGDCWEVGQVVFERWWFIFDRAVVERSNYWRRLRGAEPLRMSITPASPE